MSENEFDVQRDRAEEDRENVVLTGEEIELPGEDSDASAIIGESSEPIHTGEIESVAIGGLTGRVPAAAPLKPTIEDKISTGELPVVTAPEGDLPVVSTTDEAEAASEETPQVADGGQGDAEQAPADADAPAETANDSEGAQGSDTADEVSSEEHAQDTPTQTSENAADQQEVSADEEPAASAADEEPETGQADAESAHVTDEGAEASARTTRRQRTPRPKPRSRPMRPTPPRNRSPRARP